ncbi:MAG: nucleotide exchange factor GrpE [Candidatus Eisenbacteria bacterium]
MTKRKREKKEHSDDALRRRETGGEEVAGARDSGRGGTDAETDLLKAEVDELNDKWLRALADLDNYRRRVARDRSRWSEAAREEIILDVLEVVDNFERALACEDPEVPSDGGSLREGVELILTHLTNVLRKHGVTPIVTDGCEFDPNVHEAVGSVETGECGPNHVAEETQRGYKLGERLLRCSKVIVAK